MILWGAEAMAVLRVWRGNRMGDGKDWLDVEERGLEAKAVLCRGEGWIGGEG